MVVVAGQTLGFTGSQSRSGAGLRRWRTIHGDFPLALCVIGREDCFSGIGEGRSCATLPAAIVMASEQQQPPLDEGNGPEAMDHDGGEGNGNGSEEEQAAYGALGRVLCEAEKLKINLPALSANPMSLEELGKTVAYYEKIVTAKRLAKLQMDDGEIDPGLDERIVRGLVKDCPPPKKFSGTKEPFEDFQEDFERYAVGTGLGLGKWVQVAASYIEPKSPAQTYVKEFLQSLGKDWAWLGSGYWSWEDFCEYMEKGQLGKAPDDVEVREQLFAFKQRMPPTTVAYINSLKRIMGRAPTPLDEGTKIYALLTTCCRTLHSEICVPVTGGVWTSFAELESYAIARGHTHDAKYASVYKGYTWAGLLGDADRKGSSSSRKFKTSAVSYSGVAGKDSGYLGANRSGGYNPAAAAAGGGSSLGYGKQVRWGEDRGGSNRPGPYPRMSAAAKFGHKESFNHRLSTDDVERNKEEGRCHHCGGVFKDANGRFDRDHIAQCPQRKKKRDVSDGR